MIGTSALNFCPPGRFRKPGQLRPLRPFFFIECKNSKQILSRRDRLALILQNRLEMATLHWACQLVGIVVTPLDWRIKAEEGARAAGGGGRSGRSPRDRGRDFERPR